MKLEHGLFGAIWIITMTLPIYGQTPASGPGGLLPTVSQLDDVRRWLAENPPDGRNADARRQRLAVIQRACDALEVQTYEKYAEAWTADPSKADELEKQPALYYLRQATDAAIRDIQTTRVAKGLVVWHLYNMGYVFRTPDACFAVDLHLRDADRLVEPLDFLLVTHRHSDHDTPGLVDAMLKAKKPVVTSWDTRGLVVALPASQPSISAPMPSTGSSPASSPAERPTFRFGKIVVKVDIGDHHKSRPDGRDDMLMYQIDCGPSSGDRTIYHSGDGSNVQKLRPDRPVDVFILHIAVGMKPQDAIDALKPKMTLASHVLELGHDTKPPEAWRWSFDYAFGTIKNTPEANATVLSWGERWLAPGTELAKPATASKQ